MMTQSLAFARFYEAARDACGQPKLAANWLMGEVSKLGKILGPVMFVKGDFHIISASAGEGGIFARKVCGTKPVRNRRSSARRRPLPTPSRSSREGECAN